MPTGTMQAAGASYQWTRDQLAPIEKQIAETLDVNPYELMNLKAEQSPVGADGLFYLPYLMGERSPRWNPRARGAFIGLTIRHSRADMLRAVLEGITMNLRVILDAFRAQGTHIDAMRVIGGGARGRFWNQSYGRSLWNARSTPVDSGRGDINGRSISRRCWRWPLS